MIHTQMVLQSLKSNKNIFVEKPLAINLEQLNDIEEAYAKSNSILLLISIEGSHLYPYK